MGARLSQCFDACEPRRVTRAPVPAPVRGFGSMHLPQDMTAEGLSVTAEECAPDHGVTGVVATEWEVLTRSRTSEVPESSVDSVSDGLLSLWTALTVDASPSEIPLEAPSSSAESSQLSLSQEPLSFSRAESDDSVYPARAKSDHSVDSTRRHSRYNILDTDHYTSLGPPSIETAIYYTPLGEAMCSSLPVRTTLPPILPKISTTVTLSPASQSVARAHSQGPDQGQALAEMKRAMLLDSVFCAKYFETSPLDIEC